MSTITHVAIAGPKVEVDPDYLAAHDLSGESLVTPDQRDALDANTSLNAGNPVASAPVLSDTDPGAIGAGQMWLNTTVIAGTAMRPLMIRNATDDGWIPQGFATYDGSGNLVGFVTSAADGSVLAEVIDVATDSRSYLFLSASGQFNVQTASSSLNQRLALDLDSGFQYSGATTADPPVQLVGISSSPTFGLSFPNLPTADPNVALALWLDPPTGLLHVSAGGA